MRNTLFYRDNLEVLRKHIPDACLSLLPFHPQYNGNRAYNVLFNEHSGEAAQSPGSGPNPCGEQPLRGGAKRGAFIQDNAKNELKPHVFRSRQSDSLQR